MALLTVPEYIFLEKTAYKNYTFIHAVCAEVCVFSNASLCSIQTFPRDLPQRTANNTPNAILT